MDRKAFQVFELFKTMLEETEEAPNFVPTGGKQTNTLKLYNEQSKGISTDLCEQTRTIVRSKLHDPIHIPPFFFFFWNFKKNFGYILQHMGSQFPQQGIESTPTTLEDGVLITGAPGKSPYPTFFMRFCSM